MDVASCYIFDQPLLRSSLCSYYNLPGIYILNISESLRTQPITPHKITIFVKAVIFFIARFSFSRLPFFSFFSNRYVEKVINHFGNREILTQLVNRCKYQNIIHSSKIRFCRPSGFDVPGHCIPPDPLKSFSSSVDRQSHIFYTKAKVEDRHDGYHGKNNILRSIFFVSFQRVVLLSPVVTYSLAHFASLLSLVAIFSRNIVEPREKPCMTCVVRKEMYIFIRKFKFPFPILYPHSPFTRFLRQSSMFTKNITTTGKEKHGCTVGNTISFYYFI